MCVATPRDTTRQFIFSEDLARLIVWVLREYKARRCSVGICAEMRAWVSHLVAIHEAARTWKCSVGFIVNDEDL